MCECEWYKFVVSRDRWTSLFLSVPSQWKLEIAYNFNEHHPIPPWYLEHRQLPSNFENSKRSFPIFEFLQLETLWLFVPLLFGAAHEMKLKLLTLQGNLHGILYFKFWKYEYRFFLSGELRKKMTRACMQPSCFQKSEEHMELNQGCNEYDIHT